MSTYLDVTRRPSLVVEFVVAPNVLVRVVPLDIGRHAVIIDHGSWIEAVGADLGFVTEIERHPQDVPDRMGSIYLQARDLPDGAESSLDVM